MDLTRSVKLIVGVAAGFSALCYMTNTASAHVVVTPAEAVSASYQTFTVSVPNEKTVPTTSVRLTIPSSLQNVTPTIKSGWSIERRTETVDGIDRVTAIIWSGGQITQHLRDEFTFSARTPDAVGEVQWSAYQTYADGAVVAWDQAQSDDNHSGSLVAGPSSATMITATPRTHPWASGVDSSAALRAADWALYLAVAGLGVSLTALFIATRRRKML